MSVSRRQFLTAPLALSARAAAPSRPNVVLVMTDDQGYGDIARHGNPVIRTPNLDALHDRSVRLTGYHVSPTCAPTRSALLTGRYTNITGAWHTIQGRSLLDPREVTMADCFRLSGYRTGIFGKWHLGDSCPCRPQDRGFDEVLVHGGGGIWQTPDYFGNDYSRDTYFHNGRPEKFEGYCTDVWFDNAFRFMTDSRRRGKPFFCYIPTNAPHGPMWAPPGSEDRYRGAKGLRDPGFYGMIENVDANMARLAKYLKDSGIEDDTLLIFTTDNGSASGSQVFNAGMRANKGSAYDGGHRVPFFMHWPKGGLAGGRSIPTLTAHIDILPTLTDLCGLKRPAKSPELHGRSLKALLDSPDAAWPERSIVVDSQRLDKLVKWRQAAVMTQQWRLVNPSPDGDPTKLELYDIQKDPGQRANVIADEPAVAERLRADYERWWSLVSARGGEYVRIRLGDPREPVSRLTCHDWHGDGVDQVWNQGGVRKGPAVNGFWTVDVARAGKYRFELRRWPREVDIPLTAPFQDSEPNRDKTPGRALDIARARVQVGGREASGEIEVDAKAAAFTLQLPAGPTELRTWFTGKGGEERGAYFVYAERV